MNVSGQGHWMDKLFHKKLSGFEMSPENHVWEGIAKRLDESQKRPGLFGNWWTVLLSLIMLLIVTGAGAYMLYKKYNLQKVDKNQNKELPYLDKINHEDGTASIQSLETKTTLSTSQDAVISLVQSKLVNSTKLNNSNDMEEHPSELIQESSAQNNIESTFESTIVENKVVPTNFTSPIGANDLIASTDTEFYETLANTNKSFNFSYLPIKESFLKSRNKKLTSAILVDGCNVYKNNKSHFFLDVYYSPEIASRSLKTNDPALQSYVQERANSEKPILSYSMGVKASIVLGNGLTIRGGLSYSKNTERFDYVKGTQTNKRDIFDNLGNLIRTEYTELTIMDKVYNEYKFLDIPILLGYEKDLKDFILSVNGGIGLNLTSSETGKIYKDIYKDIKTPRTFYDLEKNGEENKPIFRNNAGASLIASIGLNYKYNERIMLLFEPSARYYLHSLSDPSNPINQNYLFLGMNIGLRYRIK